MMRSTALVSMLPPGITGGVSLLCLLMAPVVCLAQSLTGTTGLVSIPVAYLPPDGSVTVSGGFVNKKYSDYWDVSKHHYVPYGGSVAFLPFLELSVRFSRLISHQPQGLGDRSVSARLQLLREGGLRPALLVGAHDFVQSTESHGTKNFTALYIVASKTIQAHPSLPPVALHAGYGTDWIPADSRQFVGIFAGVSVALAEQYELMLEYDGEIVSVGQRVSLFDHIQILTGLQNFDVVAFGAGIYFRLST